MPKSALFDLFRPPAQQAPAPPEKIPVQEIRVAPQFADWFRNYAASYKGDPRQQIQSMNLSPQQDAQIRAVVQRLFPLMK